MTYFQNLRRTFWMSPSRPDRRLHECRLPGRQHCHGHHRSLVHPGYKEAVVDFGVAALPASRHGKPAASFSGIPVCTFSAFSEHPEEPSALRNSASPSPCWNSGMKSPPDSAPQGHHHHRRHNAGILPSRICQPCRPSPQWDSTGRPWDPPTPTLERRDVKTELDAAPPQLRRPTDRPSSRPRRTTAAAIFSEKGFATSHVFRNNGRDYSGR
jgi:hypothetical protein